MEYSRHGTLLKGQEKAHIKSRFEEDVYINNHTVKHAVFNLLRLLLMHLLFIVDALAERGISILSIIVSLA